MHHSADHADRIAHRKTSTKTGSHQYVAYHDIKCVGNILQLQSIKSILGSRGNGSIAITVYLYWR